MRPGWPTSAYLHRGSLSEGIVYAACRARLMEIGEAVKNLDPALLATAPEVRWREIARMRDQLARHNFDTDHAIVEYIVHEELATLRVAVEALIERASSGAASPRQEPPQGDDPASD